MGEVKGKLSEIINLDNQTAETVIEDRDLFKLPIRSVKGLFEEEIEKSLLVKADEDGKFKEEILSLRSNWGELRGLHDRYMDISTDTHDDKRFVQRMDELLARDGVGFNSLDLAEFLIDSRKFIDGLKRRMKVEKIDPTDSLSQQEKDSIINQLCSNFRQNIALISDLSDKRLIDLVEKVIADNSQDKIDQEIQKNQEKLDKRDGLEKTKTDLSAEIGRLHGANPNDRSLP